MFAKEGYEVDQRGEALAAKPGRLNLIPGTHKVREEQTPTSCPPILSVECGAYK